MRIAIRYSRSGPAKYVSHLDMQRAIGRAVRRARLHACYSHGFNPHLQMSFASPLSVGYETRSDYIELEVDEDQDILRAEEALRAVMPPGIGIVGVYRIPDGFGRLMSRCHSASYEVSFTLESGPETDYSRVRNELEHLSECSSFIATDKKGRVKDIMPLIYELSWHGGKAHMCVANASSATLNPAVVADVLLKRAGLDGTWDVCRTECFAQSPKGPVPFAELFEAPGTLPGRDGYT